MSRHSDQPCPKELHRREEQVGEEVGCDLQPERDRRVRKGRQGYIGVGGIGREGEDGGVYTGLEDVGEEGVDGSDDLGFPEGW